MTNANSKSVTHTVRETVRRLATLKSACSTARGTANAVELFMVFLRYLESSQRENPLSKTALAMPQALQASAPL
jgi:hypothetical protein